MFHFSSRAMVNFVLPSSRYTIREERHGYRVYMSMIVRLFSPKDVGTYNCVSTNSLGRAEGTLRLYGKFNSKS